MPSIYSYESGLGVNGTGNFLMEVIPPPLFSDYTFAIDKKRYASVKKVAVSPGLTTARLSAAGHPHDACGCRWRYFVQNKLMPSVKLAA